MYKRQDPTFSSAFRPISYVAYVAVNYDNGLPATPIPPPASNVSGAVGTITGNQGGGPYVANVDSFIWNIGDVPDVLHGGESVSWTATTLNNAWLQSDPNNGTFSLFVYPAPKTQNSGSWYRATLVTQIPEPETYAMMLAGLGLMAVTVRRRRKEFMSHGESIFK